MLDRLPNDPAWDSVGPSVQMGSRSTTSGAATVTRSCCSTDGPASGTTGAASSFPSPASPRASATTGRPVGSQARVAPIGSQIRQPTVIAWGEADPVIPAAWADRLGDTFPDHELTLLPGVGQFVPLEAPVQTIETIGRALELAGSPNRYAFGRTSRSTRQ